MYCNIKDVKWITPTQMCTFRVVFVGLAEFCTDTMFLSLFAEGFQENLVSVICSTLKSVNHATNNRTYAFCVY